MSAKDILPLFSRIFYHYFFKESLMAAKAWVELVQAQNPGTVLNKNPNRNKKPSYSAQTN
jgi:hypothetical protein